MDLRNNSLFVPESPKGNFLECVLLPSPFRLKGKMEKNRRKGIFLCILTNQMLKLRFFLSSGIFLWGIIRA
jgi:hypothetical protein